MGCEQKGLDEKHFLWDSFVFVAWIVKWR